MKKYLYLLAIGILWGCTPSPSQKHAQLRIVNAVPDAQFLTIKLSQNGGKNLEVQPSFQNFTDYQDLPKGQYHISIQADGKTLLEQKAGLAPGEKYTLVISGYAQVSEHPNQKTFSGKLHSIFGGAEASSANGFLPRMEILRDAVGCEKGKAKIRVINAYGGAEPFTIEAFPQEMKLAKKITFPKISDFTKLKAGLYRVSIKLAGMPGSILESELQFLPCSIYTLVISGEPSRESLKILSLKNEPATCR